MMIKCPECGKDISSESEKCIYCGFPIHKDDVIVCRSCGVMNKAGSTFCSSCGKNLITGNLPMKSTLNNTQAKKKKKKKHKFHPILFIVGILMIIMGLLMMLQGAMRSGKLEVTMNTPNTESSSFSDSENTEGINADKFNQIQNGMSYDEVVSIIGEAGTSISESELADIKTEIYEWESHDGWGNANITFQNEKVVNKAQFGVDSGDGVEITMDQYNSIETGMTYDEVVALLGGEGTLLSDTELAGSTSQIYMWEGTSLGANANITFSDGKVVAKAQYGLE